MGIKYLPFNTIIYRYAYALIYITVILIIASILKGKIQVPVLN
jgi:hypothetical protein